MKKLSCYRMFCMILVLFLCLICVKESVYSKEVSPKQILIQTVGKQDVYSGLLHLGLLQQKSLSVENLPLALQAVQSTTVLIQDENYIGCGVIFDMIDSGLIIATSKHLLVNGNNPVVTFSDGTAVTGEVIGISDSKDIGFIMLDLTVIPESAFKTLHRISINQRVYDTLKTGDAVFLSAYSENCEVLNFQGTIANLSWYFPEFDANLIYNYCEGRPGMSGCGTFDGYGNYIGMLIGGADDETASLPITDILTEYNKITGRTRNVIDNS